MTTYRIDLARGWLFENWLWFAKTFGMALKRQLPVEPHHLLHVRTERLRPKAGLAGCANRTAARW
jgi:hypothetical protein